MKDAVRVVVRRSQLLEQVSGQGATAIVQLRRDAIEAKLARYHGQRSIACRNGPRSTVVAGPPDAIESLVAGLRDERVWHAYVDVGTAAHTSLVDPFQEVLRGGSRNFVRNQAPSHSGHR